MGGPPRISFLFSRAASLLADPDEPKYYSNKTRSSDLNSSLNPSKRASNLASNLDSICDSFPCTFTISYCRTLTSS